MIENSYTVVRLHSLLAPETGRIRLASTPLVAVAALPLVPLIFGTVELQLQMKQSNRAYNHPQQVCPFLEMVAQSHPHSGSARAFLHPFPLHGNVSEQISHQLLA